MTSVEQRIDRDTYDVAVHLQSQAQAWLEAFFAAANVARLREDGYDRPTEKALHVLLHTLATPDQRSEAIGDLLQSVPSDTFTLALTPERADWLGYAIVDAAREPVRCWACHIDYAADPSRLCAGCSDGMDETTPGGVS